MTDVSDVETQLRALLRDAHDRVDYAAGFEDKLLRTVDRVEHTRRPVWPRIGAGLLAAALVAAVAIAAVAASHGGPRPATPTPSTPNVRVLSLGLAPGTGLRVVGGGSGYSHRHLARAMTLSGPDGTYSVFAPGRGLPLRAVLRLSALGRTRHVDVGGHAGFYYGFTPQGDPTRLAWLYRPHAWAIIASGAGSKSSPALRDVANAVRFSDQTPMRTAIALPYAPQHERPTDVFAQYPHYPGSLPPFILPWGGGAAGPIRSSVSYGASRTGPFKVEVTISAGSVSAKLREGTRVSVDGHHAYLTNWHDGTLTLLFAPAPHQVVNVTSRSWSKTQLIGFAARLRFAADLSDLHTWFDARSAVP